MPLTMHSLMSLIRLMKERLEIFKTVAFINHSLHFFFSKQARHLLHSGLTKNVIIFIFQVEAKRAVPRSEVSRESSTPKSGSGSSSPSLRPVGSTGGWSNIPSGVSSPPVSTTNLTHSQILIESRHACDPRISMDEYAYNKIFVGGLHYDTRDGECFTVKSLHKCYYFIIIVVVPP